MFLLFKFAMALDSVGKIGKKARRESIGKEYLCSVGNVRMFIKNYILLNKHAYLPRYCLFLKTKQPQLQQQQQVQQKVA